MTLKLNKKFKSQTKICSTNLLYYHYLVVFNNGYFLIVFETKYFVLLPLSKRC